MFKGLILLIILGLVGVGIYLLSSKQNTINSGVRIQHPAEVISVFYKNYGDCMKNPPKEALGQVGTYCQSHNVSTTKAFPANIERGGVAAQGAEPIVCAQNFPTRFSIGTITQTGNNAKGEVTEFFGDVMKIKTTIGLVKEENKWRVDNIICPKP